MITGKFILKLETLENIILVKIFVPPIELQRQYRSFVELADKSGLVARKLLGKLELLRGKMMQEYFG